MGIAVFFIYFYVQPPLGNKGQKTLLWLQTKKRNK